MLNFKTCSQWVTFLKIKLGLFKMLLKARPFTQRKFIVQLSNGLINVPLKVTKCNAYEQCKSANFYRHHIFCCIDSFVTKSTSLDYYTFVLLPKINQIFLKLDYKIFSYHYVQ